MTHSCPKKSNLHQVADILEPFLQRRKIDMHHFLSSLEESNHSCSGVELFRASIASERHITIHGRDYEWQSTKMPSANLHNLILGVGEVGIAHPTPIEELVPPVDLPDPKPCICCLHTPPFAAFPQERIVIHELIT